MRSRKFTGAGRRGAAGGGAVVGLREKGDKIKEHKLVVSG